MIPRIGSAKGRMARGRAVTVAGLIEQADAAVRAKDFAAADVFATEAERLAPRDPLISALKVHIARQRRSRAEVRSIVDAALTRWFESATVDIRRDAPERITRPVTLADIADHGTAIHYIDHVKQVMTDLADQPSARPGFHGLVDAMMLPGADWSPLTGEGRLLVHGMGINPRLVAQALGGAAPSVDEAVVYHPDQRVIVIGTNDNWFHFVLDYLPRLLAVKECGLLDAGWRVALGRDRANLFPAVLALLKIDDEKIIWLDADRAHHFPRAVYVSNMGLQGIPHNFALALLRRYLLPKLVDPDAPMPISKRIFVSRTDTTWRRLHNEHELYAGLERRGFEIVHPARLSLIQQVEIFRAATLVVGVHGSGLVNAVWSARPPRMIEISPLTSRDTHFSNLVKRLGGEHWRLRASAEETVQSGANRSDFSFAPEKIFTLIDEVMAVAGE
jgi:hypothetical protein